MARRDVARALDDSRAATALARVLGNSTLELHATTCRAGFLFLCGALDEALTAASEAHDLALRTLEGSPVYPLVFLARIRAARDEHDEARAVLAQIDERGLRAELDVSNQALLAAVELTLAGADAPRWAAFLDAIPGAGLLVDERIELLWFHARDAARRGAWSELLRSVDEAARLDGDAAIWRERLDALRALGQAHRLSEPTVAAASPRRRPASL
jgi:hypothetical protein